MCEGTEDVQVGGRKGSGMTDVFNGCPFNACEQTRRHEASYIFFHFFPLVAHIADFGVILALE